MTGQCQICLVFLTSQDSSITGPEGVIHSLSLFSQTVSVHLASFHKLSATLHKSPNESAPQPDSMPTERHTAQIAMALGLSVQFQAYIAMAIINSSDPVFRIGMSEMRKVLAAIFAAPFNWEPNPPLTKMN